MVVIKMILGVIIQLQISGYRKQIFGGTARMFATGFSIGNKGYIGTGYDGSIKTISGNTMTRLMLQ